jgi:hypothetical protein
MNDNLEQRVNEARSAANHMVQIMDIMAKTKRTGHILNLISSFFAGVTITVAVLSFQFPVDPRINVGTAFIQLALLAHLIYNHSEAKKKLNPLLKKMQDGGN